MINNHQESYTLYKNTMTLLEERVCERRDIRPAYNRAVNMLFIQAYKSFSSVYVLWVRGNREDAVTILRRLLEIAFQVIYLSQNEEEKGKRGASFLAYFWAVAADQDFLENFPKNKRVYYEQMVEQHAEHFQTDKNGKILDWWGGGGFRALAGKVNLLSTYDKDYRILSKFAHCTSQGILFDIKEDVFYICSNKYDRFNAGILVFSCCCMIAIAEKWDNTFNLLDKNLLSTLADRSLSMKQTLSNTGE